MTYVALLRGINVGGNNKVEMKRLKATFERCDLTHVRTYINSGNVVFASASSDACDVAPVVEQAIEDDFGFRVMVLVFDAATISAIAAALPDDWANDDAHKCDVMYLAPAVDSPGILDSLQAKPEFDEVVYVPGAVLWRVARRNVGRGGMLKLVGTPLYKQMTVRNCNTARKLAELVMLVQEAEQAGAVE
jgi:uncharacterized protein (DUF1697 family)